MAVTWPNADLPRGLSGGADAWDNGQAGALLSGDYFAPAAAAAGGFASPVLLWPYGFGATTSASLTLAQSGSIAITGTVAVTGNLAWALSITQSGQVAVSGALTTSGNLVLDIGIGGTISPSGTLSLSGELTYTVPALTISQSVQIPVTGT